MRVHTFQGHPHRDEVRIEFLQGRKCGARFVDLPELGEPGNNVSQSGYVVVVERPGPPADLNCLRIVAQLVMRGCQPGKPDEQARIAGTEADTLLRQLDRLFWPTGVEVHLSEQDVGGGIKLEELRVKTEDLELDLYLDGQKLVRIVAPSSNAEIVRE